MSKVKKLSQEDFEESYELAAYAFNFEQDNLSKEKFRAFFDEATTFGMTLNETLTSQLQVIPLENVYARRNNVYGRSFICFQLSRSKRYGKC